MNEEDILKEILVNQQMLRAILIMLSPSTLEGISLVHQCRDDVENFLSKQKNEHININFNAPAKEDYDKLAKAINGFGDFWEALTGYKTEASSILNDFKKEQ